MKIVEDKWLSISLNICR